jgi:hypothetical protein
MENKNDDSKPIVVLRRPVSFLACTHTKGQIHTFIDEEDVETNYEIVGYFDSPEDAKAFLLNIS